MATKHLPEHLLEETGGCGLYQIILCVLIHVFKTSVAWGMQIMFYAAKAPAWWCVDDLRETNVTVDEFESWTNITLSHSCTSGNGSKCSQFLFEDGISTIVSEWDLVCGQAWIPSTMFSSKMAGLLFSHILIGHLGDAFGRKKPFFASLLLVLIGNAISAFSVSWVMYLLCQVLTGVGMGGFLTMQYTVMGEFTLSRWRPLIVSAPSWTVQACLFALVAWIVPDWRYLHGIIAIMTCLWLPAWWFIPESFRWYLAHGNLGKAYEVIRRIAKLNKKKCPEMSSLQLTVSHMNTLAFQQRKYSVVDLAKSKHLRRITLLLMVDWFTLGFAAYGVSFGVKAWSGSIFLNMFLMSVILFPTTILSIYLMNRFGRIRTSLLTFGICSVSALIAGIVQYIETDLRDDLTKGFAMAANLGIGLSWGSVQTMTTEVYPTVVRSTGYGFLNIIARIGAIIGPQLVYFEELVPGILYFLCCGVSFFSVLTILLLPETRNTPLDDIIKDTRDDEEEEETDTVQ